MYQKFIVFDTETTNSLDDPFVYDIGFCVVDRFGRVYEKHSYLIAEIFLDKDLMQSAYYAEKIPKYYKKLDQGIISFKKFSTVQKILKDTMRKYSTNIIVAHNARFDYRATTTTQRYLTNSKKRFFYPYGSEIWCTLKMARQALGESDHYKEFCDEYGYYTKHKYPQKRFTAEILYRYITGEDEFIEEHTGLSDTLIEKEILRFCFQMGIENGKLWED